MLPAIFKLLQPLAWPAWVKPALYLALFVAYSATCFVKGMQYTDGRWEAETAAAKLVQATEFVRVESVIERVKYQIVPQIQVVEKQAKTIVKKVPVYVPETASAQCIINRGFVWLHEEARSGVHIPYDPERIADAAPGIGLADVARTVATNYGKFRTMKLQCQGLLDIVKSLPQGKH